MPSIYQLKPAFQNLLRPLTQRLFRLGVSDNQVTLAASVFARWLRFAVVMLATRWLVRVLMPQHTLFRQQLFLLAGWAVFYAVYFTWLRR